MGWLLWLLRLGVSLCCRHPVSCGDGGGHTATGPLLPWTAGRGREGCMYQAGGKAGRCTERAEGGRSGFTYTAPPDAAHQKGSESVAVCGAHVSSGFFSGMGLRGRLVWVWVLPPTFVTNTLARHRSGPHVMPHLRLSMLGMPCYLSPKVHCGVCKLVPIC